LKSGILITPALLFLLKIALALWGLLYFPMNFGILSFCFFEECPWDFEEDYTQSAKHF
jgi:hypothetical protein